MGWVHWPPYDVGAWVEELWTCFRATGSVHEVTGFMRRVAGALAALPFDRIGTERRVLETEAGAYPASLHQRLMKRRFGATGHGLGAYLEFGLRDVSAELLEEWRRRFFTSGNAAVWMTARPPDDLELHLPPGNRVPPPTPEPIPGLSLPAQGTDPDGDVTMSFLGPDTHAMAVGSLVAERRIDDDVRTGLGVTYEVAGDYAALDAATSHVWVSADCADSNAVLVRDRIQSILDALADNGPTDGELALLAAEHSRWEHDSRLLEFFLDRAAKDHLRGLPLEQPADRIEARRGLRPADVAQAWRDALGSALVLVPPSARGARGRYAPYGRAVPPARGTRYRQNPARVEDPRGAIVLGRDRVTFRWPGRDPRTVPFAEVAALVEDAPGTFSVIGLDGSTVEVTARDLVDGQELERLLRERIPRALWVPLPRNLAALGRLAGELEDPSRVNAELYELPGLIDPEEMPFALAEASRGRRIGAVLATDRRFLWLYAGKEEDRLDLPWQAVRELRVEREGLVVEAGGRPVRLKRIRPAAAADRIVSEFTERSRQGTTLSEA
jgi:hypothetical protein